MQRSLAAILMADVAGYTRLMDEYEAETHPRLMALLDEVVEPAIAAATGRIVKNTGDGFLACFASLNTAVECAAGIQQTVRSREAAQPPEKQIAFRMGLHVGDIVVEARDVYGAGVNLAARLQELAEPGGLMISASVREQLGNNLKLPIIDLGNVTLKNIAAPARVFRVVTSPGPDAEHPLPASAVAGPAGSIEAMRGNRAAPPSIAVLPFRNLQPGPDNEYIAEGVVEEIIHALGGLKELFVILRTSTLGFSGQGLDIRSIGHDLGVRNILHGSVRRYGDRLRIGAELSDAETGEIISNNQFDGEIANLFELQTRIAVQVTRTIAPQVHERELRRAMRKPPENRTAYDLVLQALEFLYRLENDAHTRARELLQQAICHDPDYALPYTYLAYWHVFRVGEGWSSDPGADAYEAARVAAAAIERDSSDALALAIFGHVQSFLLKDYDAAISYFDRAIQAGPNCPNAWTMRSATFGYLGHGATAIEHAEHGLRLSPLDAHVFWHEAILAQAFYIDGQYEQAISWARKAAGHKALAIFNLRTLTASLVALRRDDESRQFAQRLLQIQPNFRLASYAPRCPFTKPLLEVWIERLRQAGLPE